MSQVRDPVAVMDLGGATLQLLSRVECDDQMNFDTTLVLSISQSTVPVQCCCGLAHMSQYRFI